MAKSSQLPRPEEYARIKAERRQKAERERQRLLGQVDTLAAWLAGPKEIFEALREHIERFEQMSEYLDEVTEHITRLEAQINAHGTRMAGQSELNTLIQAFQQLSADAGRRDQTLRAQLTELANRKPPRVDLSAIQSALDALVARPAARETRVERDIGPSQLSLEVTDRDENGDIKAVDVMVTRH